MALLLCAALGEAAPGQAPSKPSPASSLSTRAGCTGTSAAPVRRRATPKAPGSRELTAAAPPPRPAEETPDIRANRHYEAGRRLHNEGLFQEAIAEFLEAYRIKPHPNVVFNIAQAYERLLRYGDAVAWFERYLAEGGPQAPYRLVVQNRLRVLRSLPARIHVECLPRATVTLADADGIVEEATTPAEFRVRAGRYTLRVTREGYEPKEQKVVADIGQPYFFQFTLEQQRELVTVRPTPAQARVILDNRLVGRGVYADRLPVGPHRLLVEYPRHEPFETEFVLRSGSKAEFNVVLRPPPPQARAEFVVGTGLYGATVLPLTLYSAGALSSDWRFTFATVVGGGGVGALAGYFATPRSIRMANSSLLLGSTLWASMEALGLGVLIDARNPRLVAGLMAGGSALGLGSALLLMRPLDLSPGQAAMFNSGGLWGTALAVGLGYAIRGDRHDLSFTMLLGLNVGLITSGVLISHFDASRMRVFIVDLGTAAGAATGVLVGFAASPRDPLRSGSGLATVARGGLVGGLVGLVATVILTRTMDRLGNDTGPGGLLTLQRGELHLGIPVPEVRVTGGLDKAGIAVTVPVARGKF